MNLNFLQTRTQALEKQTWSYPRECRARSPALLAASSQQPLHQAPAMAELSNFCSLQTPPNTRAGVKPLDWKHLNKLAPMSSHRALPLRSSQCGFQRINTCPCWCLATGRCRGRVLAKHGKQCSSMARQGCHQQLLATSYRPHLTPTVTQLTLSSWAWHSCRWGITQGYLPFFFLLFFLLELAGKALRPSSGQSCVGFLCGFFCFFFSSRWNKLKAMLTKKTRMQCWRSTVSRQINKQDPNVLSLMIFSTILNILKRLPNTQKVTCKIPDEAI